MFVAMSRPANMEILRLASLMRPYALGARELGALAPFASERAVPAGHRLLLDGPFAQELVLVGAGRGRVRCAGEVVAELGPGDAFGALAPRRAPYPTATVTATRDLWLVMFSARDLRRLRASAPAATDALLAACALAPQGRPEPAQVALAHAA